MNPFSLPQARKLAELTQKRAEKSQDKAEIVITPPFVYLPQLLKIKNFHVYRQAGKLKVGAQNLFWADSSAGGSAYTGEISAKMLKNLGVKYVIVGHSERRQWLGETDEMIAKKIAAAFRAGLQPILCVGEILAVRKRGAAKARDFVYRQIHRSIKGVPRVNKLIIVAYEPGWAIGTGVSCDPDEAERMVRACGAHLANKEGFRKTIGLYGGSVSGRNAGVYLSREYIDGLLVGGASLKIGEVKEIIEAANDASEY